MSDPELSALEALESGLETCAEYILRHTPKYGPLPEHQRLIADVIDASRESEVYAIITSPPRAGKTETLAHGLGYRTTYDPACLNFYATFGDGLAKQTSRRVRKLVRSDEVPLSTESQAVNDWRTVVDGGLKATSYGGDIMGRGCNGGLMIGDDLMKGRKFAESKLNRDTVWDWFRDDFMSRWQAGASVVLNMTRWHDDDPVGRLLLDGLGHDWLHLNFAAVIGVDGRSTDEREDPDARSYWPRVWSLEMLAKARMRGEYGWWSLYQQGPGQRGGGKFDVNNFIIVDEAPLGGRWVRRWDLAASTDPAAAFTAGAKVGLVGGSLFVADMERGQWGPGKRDANVLRVARQDGHGVEVWLPQDPGQAGLSQRPHYGKLLQGFRVHFERESEAKEIRWDPYVSQTEARNVYLVRGKWNAAFIEEHRLAPRGRVKDQIDAMAGAYYALILRPAPQENVGPMGGFVDDHVADPHDDGTRKFEFDF